MKGRLVWGRWFACLPMALLLAACGQKDPPAQPENMDLILSSRVAFYAADGKTPRAAPKEPLRVWAPYVVGDLYGSPNAGELTPIALSKDLTFTLNLNDVGTVLEKALVPTQFAQRWMSIEPAAARVARLMPFVMPADGITPIGTAEWLDEATGAKLMLIYVDRPARIRGDIVYESRKLHFDIDAAQAGYLWIQQPEGSGTFRAAPRPERLVLAVF